MVDNRPPLYQETFTRVQRILSTRRPRRFLWVAIALLAPLLALLLGWGFAAPGGRTPQATTTSPPIAAGGGLAPPPFPLTSPASATRTPQVMPEASSSRSTPPPRSAPASPGVAAVSGQQFMVAGTGGEGIVLRVSPGGERIDVYREGTHLERLARPQEVDGVTWLHVRMSDGVEGWVAAQYTTPVP
jgi:hypothetical protein